MNQPGLPRHLESGFRGVLIVCAVSNVAICLGEAAVGAIVGSSALIADAAGFIEDGGLYVLALAALRWSVATRARAGLIIGLVMAAFGLAALGQAGARLALGGAPLPVPMAATAAAALIVDLYCAARLHLAKRGDPGLRAIWRATRNDAVLDLVTICAAGLIALTGAGWPDIGAGLLIAGVNLRAALEIFTEARAELRAHGE